MGLSHSQRPYVPKRATTLRHARLVHQGSGWWEERFQNLVGAHLGTGELYRAHVMRAARGGSSVSRPTKDKTRVAAASSVNELRDCLAPNTPRPPKYFSLLPSSRQPLPLSPSQSRPLCFRASPEHPTSRPEPRARSQYTRNARSGRMLASSRRALPLSKRRERDCVASISPARRGHRIPSARIPRRVRPAVAGFERGEEPRIAPDRRAGVRSEG